MYISSRACFGDKFKRTIKGANGGTAPKSFPTRPLPCPRSQHVLTAAHCVDTNGLGGGLGGQNPTVYVGYYSADDPSSAYEASPRVRVRPSASIESEWQRQSPPYLTRALPPPPDLPDGQRDGAPAIRPHHGQQRRSSAAAAGARRSQYCMEMVTSCIILYFLGANIRFVAVYF